ncbi:hypothetical protein PPYR_10593 [Photinus pyralis]|uniref:Carboxylic ester hydrolase n=1 Tax=Photinus pyralis TaxID=7054 RepID=A0A5N4AGQ4_PHOPY|nr:venom carboxylesterase-6-like [Photinus pyralis]KAB0796532.1 hypothetical protein PPYR_10593 [Photinus pyralis]
MKKSFALLLIAFATSVAQTVVLQTSLGKIRGLLRTSRVNPNVKFYHFLGVPYGCAPVGSLRFQEAVPVPPWTRVRNATFPGNRCVQLSKEFAGDQVLGDEDCLSLDIAVPITARRNHRRLPVMVWIHGGSFLFATSYETQADPLMEEAVIVVNIQYRLNVFGFLSTGDDYAPGNTGLKDQTAALIWIQNHIHSFGGDRNRVTIFGGSAGGASVQFHMLSRRSEGLFHRAISQSGVTFGTWVFQTKPREKLRQLANALGLDHTNSATLVSQLQEIPADVLLKTAFNQSITGPYLLYDEVPFNPIVEHESPTAFLSKRAFELLRQGNFAKVPYMLGQVTEEGSFPYGYIDSGAIDIDDFEKNPELFIPISMNIPAGHPCIKETVDAIHQFFFHNGSFTDKANWIATMGQDVRGIQKSADLICGIYRNYPIYFYVFSFVGTNSLNYAGGAGHYSEVLKLFYPVKEEWTVDPTVADRLVQKRLVKLWTNFAYTGTPTPRRESALQKVNLPTFCDRKSYLDIGDDLVVKHYPSRDVYNFWEGIFEKCGFPPYNTY